MSTWGSLYGVFNRVMVLYMLYAASLPLWSHHMSAWLPEIWQCAYLRWTGVPCPLCGVTRDVGVWMGAGGPERAGNNPATPWIVSVFILLFCLRLMALFSFPRFSSGGQRLWAVSDLAVHAAILGWLVLGASQIT